VKKAKIRSRILVAFIRILFFSFLSIGVIFNIAFTRYIHLNAVTQLDNVFATMSELLAQAEAIRAGLESDDAFEGLPIADALRLAHDLFASNMFFVDGNYNPVMAPNYSPGTREIMQTARALGMDLGGWRNLRIRTESGLYYVSAHFMPNVLNTGEGVFIVAYVDITNPMRLANRVNLIMVMLVCVIFAIAFFVTLFLSNSITRPIEKLGTFALDIGRGNFAPSDFEFKDRELDELNTVLNKTAKQLSAYDGEQKAFFQNVSHELRTPLMSIKCYAEGISFGLMDPRDASETILRETDRLSELVSDLLYVSKIDNISMAFATAEESVAEIIRGCAERQRAVASKARKRFAFDFGEADVRCKCAKDLVSRALDNLISNAIRYAASEITLSCRKKGGRVEICVADDGGGIEPRVMAHIFERFYKGSGGNFGIGLSIVKTIAQQHGGSVTADNLASGGAKFTMALPA